MDYESLKKLLSDPLAVTADSFNLLREVAQSGS
jgi:hypothetical protein